MAEAFFEWVVAVGAPLRGLGALSAALVAFAVVRPRLPRTGRALTVAALTSASPPAFWYALELAGIELDELVASSIDTLYLVVIFGTVWVSVRSLASDARAARRRDPSLAATFE